MVRTVQPTSDRRFLVVVIGALVGVLGAGIVAVALLGLRDPLVATGELGTPSDITRLLTAAIALGVLLVIAGASTIAGSVRAQLRDRE